MPYFCLSEMYGHAEKQRFRTAFFVVGYQVYRLMVSFSTYFLSLYRPTI